MTTSAAPRFPLNRSWLTSSWGSGLARTPRRRSRSPEARTAATLRNASSRSGCARAGDSCASEKRKVMARGKSLLAQHILTLTASCRDSLHLDNCRDAVKIGELSVDYVDEVRPSGAARQECAGGSPVRVTTTRPVAQMHHSDGFRVIGATCPHADSTRREVAPRESEVPLRLRCRVTRSVPRCGS